ncbi:MAG: glycosyltransferase family 9 protein [Bdellovibrionaceae bacterium]|nr:glycosyltransferase family 9 protein [Pseudobdellovibrionaceae bacterium]
MKILVLSLLRVGDLIQQKPLLARLREKHPGAEIHLLVNRSVLSVRDLFPEVDLWFSFDRDGLQKQLGSAEIPILKPLSELSTLVEELSYEHYDLVYNFTHNRLSAFLASAIPAVEKKGLLAQGTGFRTFENSWLRHFNERFGTKEGTPFHYIELLAGAFDLGQIEPPRLAVRGDLLLIQPLTSDVKKNYHPTSWNRCLAQVRAEHPDLEIKILGAPFEKETLLKSFDEEDLLICEWSELRGVLQRAALLVTGDTSVKHLAVHAGVPILEIALGSADPEKTGAYADGAWVLTTAIACAPCPHHRPCRQLSHLCGEQLRPEDVASVIDALLNGREPSVVSETTRLAKTKFVPGIGWSLSSGDDIASFEKAAWSLFLDGGDYPPVGSASRHWRQSITTESFERNLPILSSSQNELATQFRAQVQQLQELALLCFAENMNSVRVEEIRRSFTDVLPMSPLLRSYFSDIRETLSRPFPSPMHFFGALKKRFEELGRRLEIRNKMIHQMEESNGRILGKETRRSPEPT